MIASESGPVSWVEPPSAALQLVKERLRWLVVCSGLSNFWDQQAVTSTLLKPWRPLTQLVESRHEPGTHHNVFVFDEQGEQLGSQEYAEGVTGYWLDENSVTIAVTGLADGARIRGEAGDRLQDAYARRRESLEKLGIPTDPKERVGFLMGKVGGADETQVREARQALLDGTHPLLKTYENWPSQYLRHDP